MQALSEDHPVQGADVVHYLGKLQLSEQVAYMPDEVASVFEQAARLAYGDETARSELQNRLAQLGVYGATTAQLDFSSG